MRDYWVYVPKQYDPAKPACLYVNQDGIQYNAPEVFDELIATGGDARHDRRVRHARPRARRPPTAALDRFNRSYEYDGLGDDYARFLLDELLPEVETKTASDGRPIRLSKDGNDRAIGGSSSGAIAAFTAAWERPDAFRRVFSAIGTYVGLRGGNDYPDPDPQVSSRSRSASSSRTARNDLNIYGGDWWMANQEMERALTFAGYEVDHAWGDGGHNGKHATEIFPDAMRWLWKDWPEPRQGRRGLAAAPGDPHPRRGLAARRRGLPVHRRPGRRTPKGEVFFNDVPDSKTYKVGLDGKVERRSSTTRSAPTARRSAPTAGSTPSPPGTEQVARLRRRRQRRRSSPTGFRGNDLVVRHDGSIYVTNPSRDPRRARARSGTSAREGEKKVVDTGLKFSNGVTLSPDQSLLYVADSRTPLGLQLPDPARRLARVQAEVLPPPRPRHRRRQPAPTACASTATAGSTSPPAWASRSATRPGRVNCIIPTPNGRVSNLCFGGEDFDILFATCGDRVYRRKVKVRGARPADADPSSPPRRGSERRPAA